MSLHEFIWAQKVPTRFYRHLTFWVVVYLFCMLSVCIAYASMDQFEWKDLVLRFRTRVFVLLICMAYTYALVYYFVPRYIYQKKVFRFALWTGLLTLLAFALFAFTLYISFSSFKKATPLGAGWIITMNFLCIGPPIICCSFLAAKMLKSYYLKMEEKTALIKENGEAELQVLKAQVHPHFLFNTLNNIYSFIITNSPAAPELVMKLSDMLRYMTNECEDQLVPLTKELKVLRDYIDLERVRYGTRLNLTVNLEGDPQKKLIAPLLLIPFIENSFKHGTSKTLEQPWVHLSIKVDQHSLEFLLENSKPKELHKQSGENGIGLKNVQKRLKLLYPQQYYLSILEKEDAYHVRMVLPLEPTKEVIQEQELVIADL